MVWIEIDSRSQAIGSHSNINVLCIRKEWADGFRNYGEGATWRLFSSV